MSKYQTQRIAPPSEPSKGRVTIPKRMNFRKSSEGGGGLFQSKKIYVADWTFKQGFLINFSEKNCNMIFQKWEGGQRLFETFPKIHLFWYCHPAPNWLREDLLYYLRYCPSARPFALKIWMTYIQAYMPYEGFLKKGKKTQNW